MAKIQSRCPRWLIEIEDKNGTWVGLVLYGKKVEGCVTADDLHTVLSMTEELYEGCQTWPTGAPGRINVGHTSVK